MKGFGHKQLTRGESTIWLTPISILEKLGVFNLDPCAAPSPRPWDTALNYIELPRDGTLEPWIGRVWLNPPYDTPTMTKFLKRMAEHGSGIACIFARTDTKVWQQWVFPKADSILYLEGRVSFHRPNGSVEDSAGAPSVLISYSPFDTYILRTCGIKGSLQRRA